MMASFHVADVSPGHVAAVMPEAPPPEQVAFTYDDFRAREMGEREWHGAARPVDIRYIHPPQQRGTPVTESQLMWMRIPDALPDEPGVHQAALAYLSDATLIDHVMLPHGLRLQDADFEGTSLDHAMWFHRAATVNGWLLFEQRVEWTGWGRGLASGRLFDAGGNLVATCVQGGLMRWKTS